MEQKTKLNLVRALFKASNSVESLVRKSERYGEDLIQFTFKNGLIMSVGIGEVHYCDNSTVELAVMDSKAYGGEYMTEQLGLCSHDQVVPYMGPNELVEAIKLVDSLSRPEVEFYKFTGGCEAFLGVKELL